MVNVMTYDLYGSWENKLGHHSALFHRKGEKGIERELNTVCSMNTVPTGRDVVSEQFDVQLDQCWMPTGSFDRGNSWLRTSILLHRQRSGRSLRTTGWCQFDLVALSRRNGSIGILRSKLISSPLLALLRSNE